MNQSQYERKRADYFDRVAATTAQQWGLGEPAVANSQEVEESPESEPKKTEP